MGYLYIALTIACTVYGQLIMKYEMNTVYDSLKQYSTVGFYVRFLFRPLVISGFAAAGLASLFWIAALSRFELSHAYPFMSLSFVLTVLLSIMLFGESLNMYKALGMVAICAGLMILGLGSR